VVGTAHGLAPMEQQHEEEGEWPVTDEGSESTSREYDRDFGEARQELVGHALHFFRTDCEIMDSIRDVFRVVASELRRDPSRLFTGVVEGSAPFLTERSDEEGVGPIRGGQRQPSQSVVDYCEIVRCSTELLTREKDIFEKILRQLGLIA
jgi:hypothetical protein